MPQLRPGPDEVPRLFDPRRDGLSHRHTVRVTFKRELADALDNEHRRGRRGLQRLLGGAPLAVIRSKDRLSTCLHMGH